jgi:hypothetical protein
MTEDLRFTQDHRGEHDVHKLLSPEMRQEIVRLSEQMQEYAARLTGICIGTFNIGNYWPRQKHSSR